MMYLLMQTTVTEIPVAPSVFWGFMLGQIGLFLGSFLKLQAQVRELLTWKSERTRPIEEYYRDRDEQKQKQAAFEERIRALSERLEYESKAIQEAIKELKHEILVNRQELQHANNRSNP